MTITTTNDEDNRGTEETAMRTGGVTALVLVEREDLALLATMTKLALAVCVGEGGKGVERGGRQGLKINNRPVKPKVATILRKRGGRRRDDTTTDNKQRQR